MSHLSSLPLPSPAPQMPQLGTRRGDADRDGGSRAAASARRWKAVAARCSEGLGGSARCSPQKRPGEMRKVRMMRMGSSCTCW